jgi:hypothetical protein
MLTSAIIFASRFSEVFMKKLSLLSIIIFVLILSVLFMSCSKQPPKSEVKPPEENIENFTQTPPPENLGLGEIQLPVVGAPSDKLREVLGIASSEKPSDLVDNLILVDYGKNVHYQIWKDVDRVVEVSLTPDQDGKLPEKSPILYDLSLGMGFDKAVTLMLLNGFTQAKEVVKYSKDNVNGTMFRFIHTKFDTILWVVTDEQMKTVLLVRGRDRTVAETTIK